MKPLICGIGNPLIDISVTVSQEDLESLGLHKGTMHLIDENRRNELLSYLSQCEKIYSCGGSCPNTIITTSAFGIHSSLSGMVGNDEFGHIYKKTLQKHSVIDHIGFCDKPTGSSIILISEDSERTMNTFLGANRVFGPEHIHEDSIKNSKYLYFTGYMWDTPSQKAAIVKSIEIAKENGTKIVFDIADPFAVSRNREVFLELIDTSADIVFANNEEARILFDNYDAYECAKSMGKLCDIAIVKNGKQGSFINDQSEILSIPVKGKDPVDTTGAGDIYAAGFLIGLCQNRDLYSCGLLASFLAGEIIGQRGAQFSEERVLLLKEQIENVI